MPSSVNRLPFCFFLSACLAGCGGSSNSGSSGGSGPTIVTYTFTGSAPTAIATQIGSGAYTQATLTSGTLTISVPSGETNFSVVYLCAPFNFGGSSLLEYIKQASTLDGTSFSAACPGSGVSQGGVATAEVDASAIAGAEEINVGSDGGCSACDTFNGSAFLGVGTYDVPITVDGNEGSNGPLLAAKILRDQTIPGALNGGAPVVFQTSDEAVPQTITYNNVPNGYSFVGLIVVYNTTSGASVQLKLDSLDGPLTQYLTMPPGTYQSGDYYELNLEAFSVTGSEGVSVTRYTSSAGPQSFTFPAPWSYSGPTAAALPTFNFAYSGFSGMSNISQQAGIGWNSGATIGFSSITMTATANYQNGSTSLTIPDLSSLTGFLAPAPSGTTVGWSAGVSQGDPLLTSPPSGTIQSVDNAGSYTEP